MINQLCAYANCKRGPGGTRNHFEPTQPRHFFCSIQCNQSASQARKRAASNATVLPKAMPEDPNVEDRKFERIMEENRGLRRALQIAKREEMSAEHIRETIYKIEGTSPAPPSWTYESAKGGVTGVPVTMWSDWHWDETVKSEEVGFLNEYNSDVQRERLKRLTQTVIDISYEHMVNPSYPGIVVNLGGDMVTGEIHDELTDTNQRYIFQTLLDLQDNLVASLTLLADQFGQVFVPCVVGNHGRGTLKPRMKGVVYTSYEWHLYNQLERYFRNDPRFTFFISPETDVHYRVYNHRILLTHGDRMGVKGGDGIIGAIGPIMRGAVKIGRSESQVGRDFDQLVIGHWHQYMDLKGVTVNGTSKGYDEFARLALRASYEPPIQALWFVNEKYGTTARWPIFLETPRQSTPNTWVSWLDKADQSAVS